MKMFSLKTLLCSFLLLTSGAAGFAQCTVASLDIGTGISDGSSTPGAGSNDHYWTIASVSMPLAATYPSLSFPRPAMVVTRPGYWSGSLSPAQWVTIDGYTASPGYLNDNSNFLYTAVYTRTFTTCKGDSIRFDFQYLNDNYVDVIEVDGISLGGTQAYTNTGANAGTATHVIKTVFLPGGVHTLKLSVQNAPVATGNPTGLCVSGNIYSAGSNIVNDEDPSCSSYVCVNDGCSDLCYWRVTGNNINGNNNLFGTLNNSDVRIITAGSLRGIFTPGGPNSSDPVAGRLGWNTMKPTARLHVDCLYGNNEKNEYSNTSDIRFENLEPGNGTVLVIDKEGYVYNSNVPLERLAAMKAEITELQSELSELKSRLAATGIATASVARESWIAQNVPNPFGKETSIEYSVKNMQQNAFIVICDLTGKQLQKYAVSGDGKITISNDSLHPGMYLYALIVDGKEIDVKKMSLTK